VGGAGNEYLKRCIKVRLPIYRCLLHTEQYVGPFGFKIAIVSRPPDAGDVAWSRSMWLVGEIIVSVAKPSPMFLSCKLSFLAVCTHLIPDDLTQILSLFCNHCSIDIDHALFMCLSLLSA
jgi:hypothetical protein